MERTLTIQASTVNGDYKEDPVPVTLRCGEVYAVGLMDVINPLFNGNILKRKVFVVRQGLDLFGTFDLENEEDFNEWINDNCCVNCNKTGTFTLKYLETAKPTNIADIYTGRNSSRATLQGTAQLSNSFLATTPYVLRRRYVRIEAFTTSSRQVPQAIDVIQEQEQGTTSWITTTRSWSVIGVGKIEKVFAEDELPNIRILS